MNWTTEDYLENLAHQLEGLSDLCLKYDDGKERFGLDICHKIRLLLYNKGQSKSLLHQLDKEKENFISTATVWPEQKDEPGETLLFRSAMYLLVKQFTLFMGKSGLNYKPHLDATVTPPQSMDLTTWLEGQIICSAQNSYSFTRKSLVLNFTDRLGGSHVDPNPILDKDANTPLLPFLKLSDNILEMKIFSGETATEANNEVSPFLATARQIAHEIFLSFQTIFPEINLNEIYFEKIASYRNVGYKTYSPEQLSCKLLEVLSYTVNFYEIVDDTSILIDVSLKELIEVMYADEKEHNEPAGKYFNGLVDTVLHVTVEATINEFKKSNNYSKGTHILKGNMYFVFERGDLKIRSAKNKGKFETINKITVSNEFKCEVSNLEPDNISITNFSVISKQNDSGLS